MKIPRIRVIPAIIGMVLVAGLAGWMHLRPASLETRYNGAYRLDDGRLLLINSRQGRTLRYRLVDGESRALWPAGKNSYTAGPGWADKSPVRLRITFQMTSGGHPGGLLWRPVHGPTQRAIRLDLPETDFKLRSGHLLLRARLLTPPGAGPFPAVVIVQGSEKASAVDTYYEPYLFAANGIATLVYDKRGTGGSEGTYTENFHVLARDVEAAVKWLRARKDIVASNIQLSGYSQGGWIAPLAALKIGNLRSLLINFGTTVPVIDEDRWGYIYSLKQAGYGKNIIHKVDNMNKDVAAIIDHGEDRWSDLESQMDVASTATWFPALERSDSALGYLIRAHDSHIPYWAVHLYTWWIFHRDAGEPFIDRLYDPVPTLAALAKTPSLWILGGQDHSIPTQSTLADLFKLRAEGRPISIHVYPGADHGILRIRRDKRGNVNVLGYEPRYLPAQVAWLRVHGGLAPMGGAK